MVLKIIQGNAKTDFLNLIADKILSFSPEEDIFLIVPNNLKFKMEIKILSLLKEKTKNQNSRFFSLSNLKIYSFNRLVWFFLNDTSYFQLPELTTSMKNMILTSILIDKNEELEVYHNFGSDDGFVDLLRKQIEIFEREGISPEDLGNLKSPELDQKKNADLSLIYKNYEEIIRQPFRNEQCDFKTLAEFLKSRDLSETNFIFFDYLQMSKVETDLFKQLIDQAKNVYFLSYHDKVMQQDPILTNVKLEKEQVEIFTELGENNDQIASIFQSNIAVKDKKLIKMYRTTDRYEEVKNIALEISRLVYSGKARYNDFLIVGNQIDIYESIFDEIFTDYQIPFFGEFKNSMVQASVTYLLKKIFDLVTQRVTINDIFDLLKTNLLFVPSDLTNDLLSDAENFALRLGISGYDFLTLTLNKDTLHKSFTKQEVEIQNFLIVQKKIQDLFIPFLKDLKRGVSAIDYANVIYDFFNNSEIFNNLNQRKNEYYEAGKTLEGDQIQQEVNNFAKLLDEAVTIFKTQRLSLNVFSQILLNGFKTKTYGMVPAVIDEVQISDLNKINLPDYQYIWIVNSIDGSLPLIHDHNEMLFSSEELEAVARETNDPFLLRYCVEAQNQMERSLDYLLMSFAKRQLYLSYPMTDQEMTLLPSTYLTDIHEKFEIPIENFIEHPTDENFKERLYCPRTALSELVDVIRRALSENQSLTTKWSTLFAWYQNNWASELNNVLQALTIKDDHEVNPEIISNIFSDDLHLSITNMETYFRNPYEFFIKYVLKIKERQISEVNPLIGGLVFHEFLDLFFKSLKYKKEKIVTLEDEEIQNMTNMIYQQVIKNQHLDFLLNEPVDRFNIEMLKRTLFATIRSIKGQNLSGKTLFTEKSFGMPGDEIQPTFDLGGRRKLKLSGKIDRLDLFEREGQKFFNVIDYKSSSRKFDLNDFYSGLDIQLITYLEVLKKYYFTKTTEKIGGSFFYRIQDPTIENGDLKKDFEQVWLKKYKYVGPYINDENYLRLINEDLEPLGLAWKDVFPSAKTAKLKNAYSDEEFQTIFKYNEKRFKTIAEMIYEGHFPQQILFRTFEDIHNYQNNSYQSILLFDPEINKDFKVLKLETPEDLFKKMKGDINE